MLKATLQLRLGQQLTMTPQLQQAIRLLQLPALDLQAHIRQALESNVMLESLDELPEVTGTLESPNAEQSQPEGQESAEERPAEVEIADDARAEQTTGPSETPWSGDSDRSQEFADERGQTLQDHLVWQLELARLEPRDQAIGLAIIDAINDDGYLIDSLDEIRRDLERRHGERLVLGGNGGPCRFGCVERRAGSGRLSPRFGELLPPPQHYGGSEADEDDIDDRN